MFPVLAHAQIKNDILTTEFNLKEYKKVSYIEGAINDKLLKSFEAQYNRNSVSTGDRLILINSGGGKVDAGIGMLNLIEADKKKGTKIVCIVTHAAHSMAFNILTHCDKRYAFKKSFCLVHKIEMSTCGSKMRHTAKYYKNVSRYLDVYDEQFRSANAKAMGLTLDDYDWFADSEAIWSANSLINMGYLEGYAVVK